MGDTTLLKQKALNLEYTTHKNYNLTDPLVEAITGLKEQRSLLGTGYGHPC